MKSIAFIDCFIQSPVNKCVNHFILKTGHPCTYHMPSLFGFDSLYSIEKTDAFIILGSASHVSDNLPWHKELIEFIIPKIEKNIPTMGICFGHQLIASHYGCDVSYLNSDQLKRVEVREVNFLETTLGISKGAKLPLAFSHSQVVKKITSDFEHIASSDICEFEGLKLKKYPYWSFQAHPEASANFIRQDAKVNSEDLVNKTLDAGSSILEAFARELK